MYYVSMCEERRVYVKHANCALHCMQCSVAEHSYKGFFYTKMFVPTTEHSQNEYAWSVVSILGLEPSEFCACCRASTELTVVDY